MTIVTIITPCFNEEENIESCVLAVRNLFREKLSDYDYEHIFSDNCSTDATVDKLKLICREDSKVKVLVNSRNIGPFRNMWSALKMSSGKIVVPFLPADLQDPPEVIEQFIRKWENGNLIVYGVRKNRQEKILMKAVRSFYYRLISLLSESEIPKHVGEFLMVDRKVLNSVLELDDEYPYIRGLIAQTGVKSASVAYQWRKRKNGKSNMTFLKLLDQGINGFVSTTRAPARIALLLGFSISLLAISVAFGIAIYVFVNNVIIEEYLLVSILLFLMLGINLFFLGLIGEYILSIHSQIRKSPRMFIVESINFNKGFKSNLK
jgi:glycosyltransferase involved in cell wall biosynthesis